MPVQLTWEQFVPPFSSATGLLFGGRGLKNTSLRAKPLGEGIPFCGEYRLHQTPQNNRDFTLVVTLKGVSVGSISTTHLWLDNEHRRSVTGIDLAAEIYAAHALQRGLLNPIRTTRTPMTSAAIATSKRAYMLLIVRGHISPPNGYEVPGTPS